MKSTLHLSSIEGNFDSFLHLHEANMQVMVVAKQYAAGYKTTSYVIKTGNISINLFQSDFIYLFKNHEHKINPACKE
jgi:hypothetical protein